MLYSNFEAVSGVDYEVLFDLKDSTGLPLNVLNCTFKFQIYSDNNDLLLLLDTPSTRATGKVGFTIEAAQTTSLLLLSGAVGGSANFSYRLIVEPVGVGSYIAAKGFVYVGEPENVSNDGGQIDPGNGGGGDDGPEVGYSALSPMKLGAIGDGVANDRTAVLTAMSLAATLSSLGDTNVVIDLRGKVYGINETILVDSTYKNIRFINGAFKAIGLETQWVESDSSTSTYFNAFQTVTADGKTWVLRKPLFSVIEDVSGFEFENVDIYCNRISAGIRWSAIGDNAGMKSCQIFDQRSYGVYVAGPIGKMDLTDVTVIGTSSPTGPRDAYGVVYAGIDSYWTRVKARQCHAPMLTSGSNLLAIDCDVSNGSGYTTVILDPRIWEHRGSNTTWIGGRIGTGRSHFWSTDVSISEVKVGSSDYAVTGVYFNFHAISADKTLDRFRFNAADVPADLLGGGSTWASFDTQGDGSWAVDNTWMSSLQGYLEVNPGQVTELMGGPNPYFKTIAGTGATTKLEFRDANTSDPVGPSIGSSGNSLFLGAGSSNWQLTRDGAIIPSSNKAFNVGSSDKAAKDFYGAAMSIAMSEVTPERRIGFNTLFSDQFGNLKFKNTAGDVKRVAYFDESQVVAPTMNMLMPVYSGTADEGSRVLSASISSILALGGISGATYSPMDYGAAGNGTTADDAAFASMQAAIQTAIATVGSTISYYGLRTVIDLRGRVYAIKNKFLLANCPGVIFVNGAVRAVSGGDLSTTNPMIEVAATTRAPIFYNVILNGNKIACLMKTRSTGTRVDRVIGYNFKGFGIEFADSPDQVITGSSLSQWNTTDTEFSNEVNYTATAFVISAGDCQVGAGNLFRSSACNIRVKATATNATISSSQLQNGGSGSFVRTRPKNIIVEQGAGNVRINNCFIDNGEVDIYNSSTYINSCYGINSTSKSTVQYLVGMYYTGETLTPKGLQAKNWAGVSPNFSDGTLPVVKFVGWPTSSAKFEAAQFGIKEVTGSTVLYYNDSSLKPQLMLMASGSGMNSGGIGFSDINTDISDLSKIGRIFAEGNSLILQNHTKDLVSIDSNITLNSWDSGKVLHVFGSSPVTVTLSAQCHQGFFCSVIQHGTGSVTIVGENGSTIDCYDAEAPYVIAGQHAKADIHTYTNDAGNNAVFTLHLQGYAKLVEGLVQPPVDEDPPAWENISPYIATLIDDPDAVSARATLGLSNVDNTSDLSKPISTATQAALNSKLALSSVSSYMQGLLGSVDSSAAKASLGLNNVDNTSDLNKPISIATQSSLNALSQAYNDMWAEFDTMLPRDEVSSFGLSLIQSGLASDARALLGLGSVDNVPDALKPISVAVQNALNDKLSISGMTSFGQTLVTQPSVGSLRQTLGLGNVNDTPDLSKPISALMQAALDNKINKSYISVFTPSDYGAVGDGSTLDDAAFTAVVTAANTASLIGSLIPFFGCGVSIDLQGKVYAIKNQIVLANPGIRICNGALIAMPGGNLSSTVAMIRSTTNALHTIIDRVIFDGNRFAAGINLGGAHSKVTRCLGTHFKGYGISISAGEGGGRFIGGNRLYEYRNADPEFDNYANFTAYGIHVNAADAIIGEDNIIRWCKECIHIGLSAGTTLIHGSHFWQGNTNPGGTPWPNPKIIVAEKGGINVVGCYFDNGEIDLYSSRCCFTGNMFSINTGTAILDYGIGLFADGATGPFAFQHSNWMSVAPAFIYGDIPLIKFKNNPPYEWPGDYSRYETMYGRKAGADNVVTTKHQVDRDPNITYFSPGNGSEGNGSKVSFIDAQTTISAINDFPSVQSNGNALNLNRHHRVYRVITESTPAITINPADSSEVLHIFNGESSVVVTFANGAEKGFFFRVIQHGTGIVTLQAGGGASMARFGVSAPYRMGGRHAVVDIDAAAPGGNSFFYLSGDVMPS